MGSRLLRLLTLRACRRKKCLVVVAAVVILSFCFFAFGGAQGFQGPGLSLMSVASMNGEPNMQVEGNQGSDSRAMAEDNQLNPEPATFEEDQRNRLENIKSVCSTLHQTGQIHTILSRNNVTYCVLPRSDNTFWLQVYRYLNNDYLDDQPGSPLDMDIGQVHNRPFGKTRIYYWFHLKENEKETFFNTKKFLSVQDPYQRLWFTYIHAMFLPELWGKIGIKIQKTVQEREVVKLRKKMCGNEVTFEDFVDYALSSYERDFSPYYQLCDPCQLQPTYVIKEETKWRDRTRVLQDLKLDWTISTNPDPEDYVIRKYIKHTIDSSYAKSHSDPPIVNCVEDSDITRRLWRSFQVRGIIPDNSVEPDHEKMTQQNFTDLVIGLYNQAKDNEAFDPEAQKRKYLSAAYRHLDQATIQRFREKYKIDFKMFGYDDKPSDIFVV